VFSYCLAERSPSASALAFIGILAKYVVIDYFRPKGLQWVMTSFVNRPDRYSLGVIYVGFN
jgi:hypothetical protein